MKILLIGHGRMGHLLEEAALCAGHSVEKTIDIGNGDELRELGAVADIAIDFSAPAVLPLLAGFIRRTGMALLSGTTGYSAEGFKIIQGLGAYAPVLHSANYSVGIAVFRKVLAQISPGLLAGFDAEIVETHHNKKADAPSGTAKLLYEAMDPEHAYTPVYGREGMCGARGEKEIGIHALRGGTVAGVHTVSFFGQEEEFSITHRAAGRGVFASGALRAAEALIARPKGFYTLDEILFGGNA